MSEFAPEGTDWPLEAEGVASNLDQPDLDYESYNGWASPEPVIDRDSPEFREALREEIGPYLDRVIAEQVGPLNAQITHAVAQQQEAAGYAVAYDLLAQRGLAEEDAQRVLAHADHEFERVLQEHGLTYQDVVEGLGPEEARKIAEGVLHNSVELHLHNQRFVGGDETALIGKYFTNPFSPPGPEGSLADVPGDEMALLGAYQRAHRL
jgi:hypothetical protein